MTADAPHPDHEPGADDARGAGGGPDVDEPTGVDDERAERERRLLALTDDGEVISADEHRGRSRRAFLGAAALGAAGALGFHRVQNRPADESIPDVLRAGLDWNARVWGRLQRESADARTFPLDERRSLRVNGRIGLADEPVAPDYELELLGVGGRRIATIAPDDVRALDARRITWEHKCIEGWSTIVSWTGARFTDVLDRWAPDDDSWDHVSLRTVDGAYYVGVDRFTMEHDQTLVAWELNDEPLTPLHGAPLRLATPLKYGIKQLKQVATIELTRGAPDDYWTERGYDDDAGF